MSELTKIVVSNKFSVNSYIVPLNYINNYEKAFIFRHGWGSGGFPIRIDKVDKATLAEYEGREDEIPGLFGLMEPMPNAIEAVHELAKHYDCYILSTAPWKNPSAWSDKVEWVTKYLDDVFHKRIILTHHKDFCKGDILIDDRPKHGASEFEGEWIQFGSTSYPNWERVLSRLIPRGGEQQ